MPHVTPFLFLAYFFGAQRTFSYPLTLRWSQWVRYLREREKEKKEIPKSKTQDPELPFLILHPSINTARQRSPSSIVLTLSSVTCPWRRLIEIHNLVSVLYYFWVQSTVTGKLGNHPSHRDVDDKTITLFISSHERAITRLQFWTCLFKIVLHLPLEWRVYSIFTTLRI